MRVRAVGVMIVAALSLAACGSSGTASSSGGSQTTAASGSPSTKGCPKGAAVSTAMGSAFTGPVTGTNGGTAPCVYSGSGGLEVNVLINAPGLTKSQFASQAQSDMGPTAAPVPGVGNAAYASTAYGHAEIEVWESESLSFSITIDTSDATVQPDNAAQAEAVAKAVLAA